MTNDERQTVIQALERAANYVSVNPLSDDLDAALAIMRREREQSKSDADSHAERQAIAERNRAVVDFLKD